MLKRALTLKLSFFFLLTTSYILAMDGRCRILLAAESRYGGGSYSQEERARIRAATLTDFYRKHARLPRGYSIVKSRPEFTQQQRKENKVYGLMRTWAGDERAFMRYLPPDVHKAVLEWHRQRQIKWENKRSAGVEAFANELQRLFDEIADIPQPSTEGLLYAGLIKYADDPELKNYVSEDLLLAVRKWNERRKTRIRRSGIAPFVEALQLFFMEKNRLPKTQRLRAGEQWTLQRRYEHALAMSLRRYRDRLSEVITLVKPTSPDLARELEIYGTA